MNRRNKALNWLKERIFLIMLAVIGVGFLTCTDNWQVYAKPLAQAGEWCGRKLAQLGLTGDDMPAMGEHMAGGDDILPEGNWVSGGDMAGVISGGDSMPGTSAAGSVLPGGGTGASGGLAGSESETGLQGGNGVQGGTGATDAASAGELTYREPEEVIYADVEDDYFADAVFIGDSRTVGMYEYGGLEEIATFYASTGLTVYKLFDSAIVQVPGQKQKQTVEEALQQNSFAKIYLMIGINEMGTGTVETFIEKYSEVVAHLRELQPEAIIYLQGIMKVTTERSEQGDYINNEGIEARNVEIAKLADNVHVYYLDVNPLICDDTGGMEPSYTYDGVHLKAQYISIWKDYLKAHAVSN